MGNQADGLLILRTHKVAPAFISLNCISYIFTLPGQAGYGEICQMKFFILVREKLELL